MEAYKIFEMKKQLSDENLANVFIEKTDGFLYKDCIQNCYYFYNEKNCLYEKLRSIYQLKIFFTRFLQDFLDDIEAKNETEIKILTERRKFELKNARGQAKLLTKVRLKIPDSTEFIMENFNRKKNLFPFQDKVVDFSLPKDDENFIRKRTKDDYFTFTTNNEYKLDFERDWLINHASQLLKTKNQEYINCFYTLLAHGLTNDNSIKLMTFWIGDGDNGKSAMMNLYKSVMGDFCCRDSSKAILQKRGTEKFTLVGKRVGAINGLRKEDNLNTTFVKNVLSDDRQLMSIPKEYSAQILVLIDCKFVIQSNEMPHIPEKEIALLKRIVCFDFCNTFARSSEKLKEIASKKDDLFTYLCQLASELTRNEFVFTPCEEMSNFTRKITKNTIDR